MEAADTEQTGEFCHEPGLNSRALRVPWNSSRIIPVSRACLVGAGEPSRISHRREDALGTAPKALRERNLRTRGECY